METRVIFRSKETLRSPLHTNLDDSISTFLPVKTLQLKAQDKCYHLQPDPTFPDKDSYAQPLVRLTLSLNPILLLLLNHLALSACPTRSWAAARRTMADEVALYLTRYG